MLPEKVCSVTAELNLENDNIFVTVWEIPGMKKMEQVKQDWLPNCKDPRLTNAPLCSGSQLSNSGGLNKKNSLSFRVALGVPG